MSINRIDATPRALEIIQQLKNEHGELMFHQSGGCCEGSYPHCFEKGGLWWAWYDRVPQEHGYGHRGLNRHVWSSKSSCLRQRGGERSFVATAYPTNHRRHSRPSSGRISTCQDDGLDGHLCPTTTKWKSPQYKPSWLVGPVWDQPLDRLGSLHHRPSQSLAVQHKQAFLSSRSDR